MEIPVNTRDIVLRLIRLVADGILRHSELPAKKYKTLYIGFGYNQTF